MSTGPLSTCAGRARLSRLLTILAARNVCRSIFSSTLVCGSSGSAPLEQHLREARDAGERRVDLVRDAGGEQADRRHLLGDLQLLFELHARAVMSSMIDDPAGIAPSAIRSGVVGDVDQQAALRLACRGRERHAVERGAVGRLAPRAAQRPRRTPGRRARRGAARPPRSCARRQLLQPAVPAHDAIVAVDDERGRPSATRRCSR